MKGNTKLGIIAILVLVLFAVVTRLLGSNSSNSEVTLRAAPGNTVVQMFESVGPGPNDAVARFPSSTRCTKIGGPTSVTIEGLSMRFYRLECNGTTGYVNARWVEE